MKILNLYAGIGGNRKLWGKKHKVVAIEINKDIAFAYKKMFPSDQVYAEDAHKYLLENFEKYDFIWSSPPCPTHSQLGRLRYFNNSSKTGCKKYKVKYPDMKLYEEILLLKYYFKGKYCVENVIAYYKPLIPPTEIQRHHFWSNFYIPPFELDADNIDKGKIKEWESKLGYDLSKYQGLDKKNVLRNCVRPELGKHILDCALGKNKQKTLL